jgi:hypothetical protein
VELGESGRSITLVKKLSHNYKFDPLIALHQCFVRERKWKKKNFPITCSKYGRINWKKRKRKKGILDKIFMINTK